MSVMLHAMQHSRLSRTTYWRSDYCDRETEREIMDSCDGGETGQQCGGAERGTECHEDSIGSGLPNETEYRARLARLRGNLRPGAFDQPGEVRPADPGS